MNFVRFYRWVIVLMTAIVLTACGFHLRGAQVFSFNTLYIDSPSQDSLTKKLLIRQIKGMKLTNIVDSPKDAQVIFSIVSEKRKKTVLSYNSDGRAREYSLFLTIEYVIRTNRGEVLIEPTTLSLNRAMTYDDSEALSKEHEEDLLYKDMQSDIVQQMLRRISAIKLSQEQKTNLTTDETTLKDSILTDDPMLVPVDLSTTP